MSAAIVRLPRKPKPIISDTKPPTREERELIYALMSRSADLSPLPEISGRRE